MSDIALRLKAVTDFIEANNAKISEGNNDLFNQMEKIVVDFCAYAATQPFDEVIVYKENIEGLSSYLTKLAEHLNLRHSDVVRKVEELRRNKRASTAYKNASGGENG